MTVHLLWLFDSLTRARVESVILPFVDALDRQKWELTVGCLKSTGGNEIEERLRKANVPVVNIAALRRLRALIKERRIDIIHAHVTDAAIWGALTKTPLVVTLHAAPTTERTLHRDSIREMLMIFLLRLRKATIVAVSDSVRKAFIEKYRLPPNSIEVIYYGVKVADFERRNQERSIQLKQRFSLPADAQVLTTVAFLRLPKGIDVLLRAMQVVVKSVPQARLLVVGEGPLQDQWSNLARHLGVADAVTFTGYRKDVPAILAGSDLFVLPSREDAFPISLLEAIAADVPIVATNVGGVPEIIDSPEVGSIVAPRDPAALAAEIVKLLGDEKRRRSMAVAARRRVAESFPMQRMIEKLTKAYEAPIGQRTGPLRVAVVEFAGKGGPIHYAFQLSRAMAKEGANVTLLTDRSYELDRLEHPFRLLKIFEPHGDPTPNILQRAGQALRAWAQWLKLETHLGKEKYDVLQLGDLHSPADYLPLLTIRGRVPLLADICHNVRRVGFAYERSYRKFDRIFVHYKTNAARFKKAFPSSAGKVRVIVHGNQEMFHEMQTPGIDVRAQLGLDRSDAVVLFLGTLSRSKGIDVLIEAFASVGLRHPNARLLIAGQVAPDFNVERQLALARGFALGDRVRIVPGYVRAADVAAWMEMASMIVLPYREIDHSDTVHLAQTFGVPIIATRVGAIPEVIEDRVTGMLVPPDDPHELGDAISRLLANPELAMRLGDASRAAADQLFNWRGVARQILSEYERQLPRAGDVSSRA